MSDNAPNPAQQRLVALAILGGALLFAVVVPFLLPREGGGIVQPPLPVLDLVAVGFGAVMLVVVQVLHKLLLQRAAAAPPEQAATARFTAMLLPLALLEGAMMFSCVSWLLNGSTLPCAVVFAVLFARGLLLVPANSGS